MNIPLSILTATVVQLAELQMPKAEACITLPNAPRPRGFSGKRDNKPHINILHNSINTTYKAHTQFTQFKAVSWKLPLGGVIL